MVTGIVGLGGVVRSRALVLIVLSGEREVEVLMVDGLMGARGGVLNSGRKNDGS